MTANVYEAFVQTVEAQSAPGAAGVVPTGSVKLSEPSRIPLWLRSVLAVTLIASSLFIGYLLFVTNELVSDLVDDRKLALYAGLALLIAGVVMALGWGTIELSFEPDGENGDGEKKEEEDEEEHDKPEDEVDPT